MIANYGYQDASGVYYIRIDTSCCVRCVSKPCVSACPRHLFECVVDDYDDTVVQVAESGRRSLASQCVACKPTPGRGDLPCIHACPLSALSHSW